MKQKCFAAALSLAITAGPVRADFTFEQTTKLTGGMMAGMMKFAGAFSKEAREPMRSTVTVKGDRMAMTSAHRISIIDLSAETMTEVDLDKKTYAVITFADVKRAMDKMSQKMGEQNQGELNFKADVKQTGATRTINGFQTKETVLTMTLEGQDQKSGGKGAINVVTDMWLTPNIAGYDEVREFYSRMAQKLAFAPGMGGMGAMMGRQAGLAKSMSQMYGEVAKIDGVPVLQVIRMGGVTDGMSEADLARAQQGAEQPQQPAAPAPSASDVAGSAATSAAANKMGRFGGLAAGGMGGFGGFGRKKKQEQEQPAAAQPQAPAATQTAAAPAGGTPPGTLMEMTTELTAFSSAPVDSAKLSVPTGFKQVEHDMSKALK